jgi:hypothetical protein
MSAQFTTSCESLFIENERTGRCKLLDAFTNTANDVCVCNDGAGNLAATNNTTGLVTVLVSIELTR